MDTSASAGTLPASEVLRLLTKRFDEKLEVLEDEESDSKLFDIDLPSHNLMTADGAVTDWDYWQAVRELVTNWIDENTKAADEAIGNADAVVFTVLTRSADEEHESDIILEPGFPAEKMLIEWHCTASVCGVETGELMFAREHESDHLHAFIRNRLTCLNVLKIYGYGYSTKVGDSTQSGRFGDGLKSATATLNRAHVRGAPSASSMTLTTKGRKWTFTFERDSQGEHSWLLATKKEESEAGKAFNCGETLVTVTWRDQRDLEEVFNPDRYLVFAKVVDDLKLTADGNESILFDEKYHYRLYVAGVYVCKCESFNGFGVSSEGLKRKMNRDRSSIDNWAAAAHVVRAIVTYIEGGGAAERIYSLVERSDTYGLFFSMSDNNAKVCASAFVAEFKKRHDEKDHPFKEAYPYKTYDQRRKIEDGLGLVPVQVSSVLYNILCSPGAFLRVEDAVTQRFATVGKPVDWPVDSRVRTCAEASVALLASHGYPKGYNIELALRDIKSRYNVCVFFDKGTHIFSVYLRWAVIRRVEKNWSNASKLRELMFDIFDAIIKATPVHIRVEGQTYVLRKIAKFSEGNFHADGPSDTDSDSDSDEDEEDVVEDGNKRSAEDMEGGGGLILVDSPVQDERPAKRHRAGEPLAYSAPQDTLPCPCPKSVDEHVHVYPSDGSYPAQQQEERAPTPNTTHAHSQSLVASSTSKSHNAVFFRTPDIEADVPQFERVCNSVAPILQEVFGWDKDVSFGVYYEDSDTMAFTRDAKMLYINAKFHPDTGIKADLHYFHVICHETVHMIGYMVHNEGFTSALYTLGVRYHLAMHKYMLSRGVDDEEYPLDTDAAMLKNFFLGKE